MLFAKVKLFFKTVNAERGLFFRDAERFSSEKKGCRRQKQTPEERFITFFVVVVSREKIVDPCCWTKFLLTHDHRTKKRKKYKKELIR